MPYTQKTLPGRKGPLPQKDEKRLKTVSPFNMLMFSVFSFVIMNWGSICHEEQN